MIGRFAGVRGGCAKTDKMSLSPLSSIVYIAPFDLRSSPFAVDFAPSSGLILPLTYWSGLISPPAGRAFLRDGTCSPPYGFAASATGFSRVLVS